MERLKLKKEINKVRAEVERIAAGKGLIPARPTLLFSHVPGKPPDVVYYVNDEGDLIPFDDRPGATVSWATRIAGIDPLAMFGYRSLTDEELDALGEATGFAPRGQLALPGPTGQPALPGGPDELASLPVGFESLTES
jgi:hypothetical protein